MNASHDLIITGAGPTGCAAAYFAAQQGLKVLLVDKAVFPRDKACGDGISAATLEIFFRMGLKEKLEALNPWRTDGMILTSPDGTIMRGEDQPKEGIRRFGYVIPRKILDDVIFRHVQTTPGVDVLEGFEVKGLVKENGLATGILGKHQGQEKTFSSRFIIGADGAHSITARSIGLQNTSARHKAFGIRAYFENVSGVDNSVEFHFERHILPAYGWMFPTGPDTANVGVGIACRFLDYREIQKRFFTFLEKNRFISKKLKNARMKPGTLRAWPIPCGTWPSRRSAGNVLLCGDAGSFVDSVTGEGIYYGLRTSEFAVCAMEQTLLEKKPETDAGSLYEKLWTKEFKWKEYMPGYMMQPFFKYPWVMNMAIRMAAKSKRRSYLVTAAMGHGMPKANLLLYF